MLHTITHRSNTAHRSNTGRRVSLVVAGAILLGACGSSSESGLESTAETAPTTAAATETTTSETTADPSTSETSEPIAEETTTTAADTATTAPPADGGGDDPFDGMTDEERQAILGQMGLTEAELAQFEALLDSEVGRQAMAEGIVASTGLTIEQSLCIVENGDIIGLMIGVSGGMTEPDAEITASFLQTLDTCDIPLSAFQG